MRRTTLQISAIVMLVGAVVVASTRAPDPTAPEATAAIDVPDAPDAADPSAIQSEDEREDSTVRALDNVFDHDVRDEAWASTKEASLRGLAGDHGVAGVRAVDAACRSTICRLRVAFVGQPSLRALKALRLRPEMQGGGYHSLDREGSGMTIYLGREGTDLASNPQFVAAIAAR